MKKKLISTILSASILLSMFSVSAFALEGGSDEDTSRFGEVLVSNAGTNPTIIPSNTARKLAVTPDGTIFAAYRSDDGVFVTKSTDEGQTFSPAVKALASGTKGLDSDTNVEITVSSTGIVYLGWSSSEAIYISKSVNNGADFSDPITVQSSDSASYQAHDSIHMAVDGDHIYIIRREGTSIYVSSNGGESFDKNPLPGSPDDFVYSDLHVDPSNHNLIVQEDNPTIKYYISTDFGESFSDAVLYDDAENNGNNPKNVYYSVGAFGSNGNDKYLLIGGRDNTGYRINLDDSSVNAIDVNANSNNAMQGRSLSADTYGNLVTGYSNNTTSYQWQKNTDGEWTDIGDNSPIYMHSPLTQEDNGTLYRCVLTDIYNGTTLKTVSPAETITLNDCASKPKISLQPVNQVATLGDDVHFSISATSDLGDITYRWQKENNGSWEDVFNGTSPVLAISAITSDDYGVPYRCVITCSYNGTEVTSTSSAATIMSDDNASFPVIETQPVDAKVKNGETVTFSTTASLTDDGDISYQWQKSVDGLFTNIDNATSASYTTDELTSSDSGTEFRCLVQNTTSGKTPSTTTTNVATAYTMGGSSDGLSVTDLSSDGFLSIYGQIYLSVESKSPSDNVYFIVSHDLGDTFTQPTKVANSTVANAAINTTNGDILFLYERDGQVYLRVYGDRLDGYSLGITTSNLYFNADDDSELTKTVTITNKSSEPIPITSITPTDNFVLTDSTPPSTLAPGESYEITATYIGDKENVTNGEINIVYGSSGDQEKTINLTVGHTASASTVEAPTVVTQPESQTKDVGETATFTVDASVSDGGNLSYQWQKLVSGQWKNIDGETLSTYETNTLTSLDNDTNIRCVVTNTLDGKSKSVQTTTAVITLNSVEVGLVWGNTEFTYNGQPQVPTATATGIGEDECIVNVSGEKTDVGENYVATATSLSNSNYVLPSEGTTTTFKIKPATISDCSVSQAEDLIYSGEYQTAVLSKTGTTVDGSPITYVFSTSENGDYSLEIPQFKDAGTHMVYFKATSPNHEEAKGNFEVTINAITQSAPVVTAKDETCSNKKDGMIFGLSTEMEISTSPTSGYKSVTDPNMELESGTYYVRYKENSLSEASAPTQVTINKGPKIKVNLPTTTNGYTITPSRTELDYGQAVTFTITFDDGYGKGENFEVTNNGESVDLPDTSFTLFDVHGNINIRVSGVCDIAAPTAQIEVGSNIFNTLLNTITFNTYFKETQQVTITAQDNEGGSGLKTLQYYLSDSAISKPSTITDWQDYNGSFNIDPNNNYVIYVRAQDNDGNIKYISSDGLVLDNVAPTIKFLSNGETCYGSKTLRLDDDVDKLYVDGNLVDFSESDPIVRADNNSHTLKVVDKAGNFREYTITVYKLYNIFFYSDGQLVDTQTVGYGESATAPEIPAKTGYDQVAPYWDVSLDNITADTTVTAVYTKNIYDITFKIDGEVVDTQTVAYGESATAPSIPSKEGYDKVAPYWDASLDNITGNTIFTAVYTKNTYDVTFKIDGEVVDTQTVEYGETATAPEIPAKTGYDQVAPYWDASLDNITGETTFTAVYTKNIYDVTFKIDGEVVDTQTVAYGESATAPEIPTKTGYDKVAPYWNASIDNITGNTIFTAVYTKNTYDVTFKIDGEVVDTQTVEYGESVTAPEIPAKIGYNKTAPTWDKALNDITSDLVVNAVYTKNDVGTVNDTTPSDNDVGGKISNTIDDLKNSIDLTEDEQTSIDNGEDMNIFLIVKDVTNEVNTDDKEKAENVLTESQKLGLFIDISLYKQIGTNDAVKIPNTNGKITVTIDIPDELLNSNSSVSRIYNIVRVHNGVASIIDCIYDAEEKTVTFETDKFSTYALAYEDTVIASDDDNSSTSTDTTEESTDSIENPETGSKTSLPIILLALMELGFAAITLGKRVKD